MTNHIIETIGSWGVRTTSIHQRMLRVEPGDAVSIAHLSQYPFLDRDWATVASIDRKSGLVALCIGNCSVFLNETGGVSISGGPFCGCEIGDLEPQHTLREQRFWNWGDNFPGGGQGVEYTIARPVFKLNRQESNDES